MLLDLEAQIKREAIHHDPVAYHLLKSIPGVGPILALVVLYEIGGISRFPQVRNFLSYARLVKCAHESAGKRTGGGHNKIGKAHLTWAFSEAAVLFLRDNKPAQQLHQRLVAKYGKAKALSIIAQKLGRTVYFILKKQRPSVARQFFGDGVRVGPCLTDMSDTGDLPRFVPLRPAIVTATIRIASFESGGFRVPN